MSLPDITPRRAAGFAAAAAVLDATCCVEPGGSNAVDTHKTHIKLTLTHYLTYKPSSAVTTADRRQNTFAN